MRTLPLNTAATAVIPASGNVTVSMGPRPYEVWKIAVAAIVTSTAVKIPTCKIYMGATAADSTLVDGTYVGNLNSTDRTAGLDLQSGEQIFAKWEGADVGATATLSVVGTIETQQ